MNYKSNITALLLIGMFVSVPSVFAEESQESAEPKSEECIKFASDIDADLGAVLDAGCEPTLAQMSALMDNPVGTVAMWWNQYDSFRIRNDATGKEATQGNYMGILQFPLPISDDWNLINRFIYNVGSSPIDQGKLDKLGGLIPPVSQPPNGGATVPAPLSLVKGRTTGLGDTYYVGLFSPKEAVELDNNAKFVWGAGFDIGAPTAKEDVLGANKWIAGPSALAVYLGEEWKFGALLLHYWDFGSDLGGDSDAPSVNLTNLQYFYYYSLSDTSSIGAGPNIIVDWEQDGSDRFTVPIGIGYNDTIQLGKIPVRYGAEAYYSVIKPDSIPSTEWSLRFFAVFAVPAAAFSWMR